MKTTVDTYENRIEVSIAVPDDVESVAGGASIRADEDGSNRRAVWCFPLGWTDEDDAFHATDPKQVAQEAYLLLVASTPGDTAEPAPEQPSSSETVTVTL